jgi:hypothetical protein
MCFDYYRNNLIVDDDLDGKYYDNNDSQKEISGSDSEDSSNIKKKFILGKKLNFRNKIRLSNKNLIEDNKKEIFKSEKINELQSLGEYEKELLKIVQENQQFMNNCIKNNELQENIDCINEFIMSKPYFNEFGNLFNLFDLRNFLQTMENSLKLWSPLELDSVNS